MWLELAAWFGVSLKLVKLAWLLYELEAFSCSKGFAEKAVGKRNKPPLRAPGKVLYQSHLSLSSFSNQPGVWIHAFMCNSNWTSTSVLPVQLSNLGTSETLGLPSLWLQAEPSSFESSVLWDSSYQPVSLHSNHKLFKLLPANTLDMPLKEEQALPFTLICSLDNFIVWNSLPEEYSYVCSHFPWYLSCYRSIKSTHFPNLFSNEFIQRIYDPDEEWDEKSESGVQKYLFDFHQH